MKPFSLEKLAAIIDERATVSADTSYTAALLNEGVGKCAEKLGEEAIEAIIAAVSGHNRALTAEAADVLYHLLVLLKVSNVSFVDVMDELERRTARSGISEKAARQGVHRKK